MSRWAAILLLVLFSAGVVSRAAGSNVKLQTISAATLSARGNHWNAAIAGLSNTSYQSVHADLVVRLNRMSNVEIVQPVWIPARSSEVISLPVFCPFPRPGKKETNYTAWLATVAGNHIIARNTGGMFTPAARHPTMAITDDNDQSTADLAVQMRKQEGLTSVIAYTNGSHTPFVASEYDGVYAIYAASRHMALTGQQINAMRRWLISGGRLWIQGERVRSSFGRALLGSDWTICKVGQTRTATLKLSGHGIPDTALHLKRAIHLAYLLAPGYQTLEKINGWPAVLMRRVGLGRVYVCSVNGRGLLNKSEKDGAALWPIVRNFYQGSPFHPPLAALKDNANSQIGYRISGRLAVGAVLIGLTIALILAGLILGKKDRLEQLAPVAIALAVVAGIVLIVNGKLNRGKVNLTLSSYQIANVSPAQHLMAVTGFASIFSPNARGAEMLTSSALKLNPKQSFSKQPDVRLMVQSGQKFNWRNIRLPSAATIDIPYASTHQDRILKPVSGEFGPSGLQISGQESLLASLQDSAIAAPRGALGMTRTGPGRRLAGANDILPAGQFIESSFLTRSQQRHNLIESELFNPTRRSASEALLLGWTSQHAGIPLMRLTHHPVTMHQTLLVIPVDMRHSAAGTRVALPWPFLPWTLVPGPGQHAPAPVYDTREHHWLRDLSSPANIYLRFQFPRQVLPLKITSAALNVAISAPNRPVAILVQVHGHFVRIGGSTNGGGTLTLHPTAAEMAAISDSGGWRCEIRVGGNIDPNITWHVTSIDLSAAGTVAPARSGMINK
jgi:hypothetical protein